MLPNPNDLKIPTPGTLPQVGRLTNPVGTFLSNPSTAADGMFGGAQPSNIPTTIGATQSFNPYANRFAMRPGTIGAGVAGAGNQFATWLKNLFSPQQTTNVTKGAPTVLYAAPGGAPIQGHIHESIWDGKTETAVYDSAYDQQGNKWNYDTASGKWVRESTSAFAPSKTPRVNTSFYTNDFVGRDFSQQQQVLGFELARQLFPGRSFDEIKQLMASKGYVFETATKGRRESAGSFVFTGEKGAAPGGGGSAPSAYEQGGLNNPIKTEGGDYLRMGTPTAEGNAQMSLTVSQNLDKKFEEKGGYKWVSKVYQNENGDWIKVNYKAPRKVYGKRAQRLREAREEAQGGNPNARPGDYKEREQARTNEGFHQLVTLRANYG